MVTAANGSVIKKSTYAPFGEANEVADTLSSEPAIRSLDKLYEQEEPNKEMDEAKMKVNKKFPRLFPLMLVLGCHFLIFVVMALPKIMAPKDFAGAITISSTYAALFVAVIGAFSLNFRQVIIALCCQGALVSGLAFLACGRWLGYEPELLNAIMNVLDKAILIPSLLLLTMSVFIPWANKAK